MDFITLAKERYSVRQFNPKPIEQEKLELVLKAGQLAPTAANVQPQRILVLNREAELVKLKECTPYHFNAPAALLVCYDKTVSWRRKYDQKDSGDVDASIVTTHMMLEAAAIGLGSTWVMYFDPEKMKEAYQIPDHFVPVALLVIGYPADDAAPAKMHRQRHAIDHTVFYHDFSGGEGQEEKDEI
ncbi:nitroreductase [Syntrophobotulus glycolicus DSM 8271]|uniref:Nitroreductase n=1 Tax=Syntrophobotulus glycolicus (strain DSM 8271 / FlGlyR) TaxID=645991 RepID=F0T2E8_SYNGF|nr:nitroreductase family protein [Syntrophobotulus glycolicus]ADY55266.1 nitroreductase [Syntrophobotulus glycolicus DSM 8271]